MAYERVKPSTKLEVLGGLYWEYSYGVRRACGFSRQEKRIQSIRKVRTRDKLSRKVNLICLRDKTE